MTKRTRRIRQPLELNKVVPITAQFSNYFTEDDMKSVSVERAINGNLRVIIYDHSEGFKSILDIREFDGKERKFAEGWIDRHCGLLVSFINF